MSQQNNNDTPYNKDSVDDNSTSSEIESKVADFIKEMPEFKYGDVKYAINKFAEMGMTPKDLSEQIAEFRDESEIESDEEVGIVYIVWDYIKCQARNKIQDVLNVDIDEDDCGGHLGWMQNTPTGGITFECGTEFKEGLKEIIQKANDKVVEELIQDKCTNAFLESINMDIKKIRESKTENVEEIA